MHRKSQADQHRRTAENYLRQTENIFVIDPATGLYRPQSVNREDHIDQNTDSEFEDRPIFVFPEVILTKEQEWSSPAIAIATIGGVLISTRYRMCRVSGSTYDKDTFHTTAIKMIVRTGDDASGEAKVLDERMVGIVTA